MIDGTLNAYVGVVMRRFSIIIPSWKDYDYLKLCLESIRSNSISNHEILIHLNTYDKSYEDLVRSYDPNYSKTDTNKGIAYGSNRCVERASTEWLFFSDSDCVFLPNWDIELNHAIDKFGDENIYPVTKIEPTGNNPACIIRNYGRTPNSLQYEKLLNDSQNMKRTEDKYQVISAGPWLSPKSLFEGFDERMFPGWNIDADAYVTAYSIDPDMRFIKPWNSLLYHFSTTSTGKIGNQTERQIWTQNAYDIFDTKWCKVFPGMNTHNYQKFIEQPVKGLKGR